jgi:hypothetical protein
MPSEGQRQLIYTTEVLVAQIQQEWNGQEWQPRTTEVVFEEQVYFGADLELARSAAESLYRLAQQAVGLERL